MSAINGYARDIRQIHRAGNQIRKSFESLSRMAMKGDYETRMEALEALDDSGFNLGPLIRKAMRDRSDLVRTTAIEIAGGHDLHSLSDKLIQRVTSDRSPLVRSAAAVALGEMQVVKARGVLEKRLRDSEEEERFPIYYSLVKLGRSKYLGRLLNALTHDFYRIRYTAAHLLPGIVSRENIKMVRKNINDALERETTVLVRASLQEALEEIDSARHRSNSPRRGITHRTTA